MNAGDYTIISWKKHDTIKIVWQIFHQETTKLFTTEKYCDMS